MGGNCIQMHEIKDQTAQLTGVKPPPVHLDGRSLSAVLNDSNAPSPHADHPLHWQVGGGRNADWAVRDGVWKLIGRTRDTTDGRQPVRVENYLVNLETDPGETTNLAQQQPEIVERLTTLHDSYLEAND